MHVQVLMALAEWSKNVLKHIRRKFFSKNFKTTVLSLYSLLRVYIVIAVSVLISICSVLNEVQIKVAR